MKATLVDKTERLKTWPSPRSRAGFTLVEMLAALVVLMLLTGIVVTGVSVGMATYQKTTFASESEALSSTIDSALSGPLRYAQRTADGASYTITYRSAPIKSLEPASLVTVQNGKLYWGTGTDYPLLNDSAYADCKVASASVTPNESSGVFTVTYTIVSKTDSSLTKVFGTSENPIEYRMSSLTMKAS